MRRRKETRRTSDSATISVFPVKKNWCSPANKCCLWSEKIHQERKKKRNFSCSQRFTSGDDEAYVFFLFDYYYFSWSDQAREKTSVYVEENSAWLFWLSSIAFEVFESLFLSLVTDTYCWKKRCTFSRMSKCIEHGFACSSFYRVHYGNFQSKVFLTNRRQYCNEARARVRERRRGRRIETVRRWMVNPFVFFHSLRRGTERSPVTLMIIRCRRFRFYGYRPVSGSYFEFWQMNRNFHSACLVTEIQLVSNFSSSLRVRSRQTKTLAHWPALATKLKHAEIRLLNALYCALASLHWLVLTTLFLLHSFFTFVKL